jgi:hypothetical protein
VKCSSYVSTDDECHHSQLFTHVRYGLSLQRLSLQSNLEGDLEHMRLVFHRFKEAGLKLCL